MGVMDWMNGEKETSEESENPAGALSDWMESEDVDSERPVADGGPDDGLGLGFDEDDDLDDGIDDDIGDGFDDGFGDGFDDDIGGNDGNLAEIEDRVGELENQVSSISSQVNTVREENKQIGETVNDLDDTIRKLLDIYEMVTRGINPFVDDAQAMGGLDTGGAFGLFEAEEEEEDDLDTSVANAEAESFFDDDFGDLDAEEGMESAEAAAGDELEGETAADPTEEDLDEDMTAQDGEASGSSFEDLKSEYEDGEGWEGDADDERDEDRSLEAEIEPAPDETTLASDDESRVDDEGVLDGSTSAGLSEAASNPNSENDASEAAANGTDDSAAAAKSSAREVRTDSTMFNEEHGPYLASLPGSYMAEIMVLEWVEYLVEVSGSHGAMRAVRQYREYGWISAPVREALDEYVMLVADDDESPSETELTVEHHSASLTYVSRLAGDVTTPRSHGSGDPRNGGGLHGLRR